MTTARKMLRSDRGLYSGSFQQLENLQISNLDKLASCFKFCRNHRLQNQITLHDKLKFLKYHQIKNAHPAIC